MNSREFFWFGIAGALIVLVIMNKIPGFTLGGGALAQSPSVVRPGCSGCSASQIPSSAGSVVTAPGTPASAASLYGQGVLPPGMTGDGLQYSFRYGPAAV